MKRLLRWTYVLNRTASWVMVPTRTLAAVLLASSAVNVALAQAPASPAIALVSASESPVELQNDLPGSQFSGAAKLTYWGLDIYNASLWVAPGFQPTGYAQHPFALQLTYLRGLDGAAIAKRSIDEMQRQANFSAERARAWQSAMEAIFPNVKSGDRITGIHKPGTGARFLLNGKARGDIADAEFARLFFGIWLSDSTSEPGMRRSLLGQKGR